MDELEFQRLLLLFPLVRPRDYHADSEPPKPSTSQLAKDKVQELQGASHEGSKKDVDIQGINKSDAFWEKIKTVVERKVGAVEAEKFCKAFRGIHKKLVFEELSLNAAKSFLESSSA